MGEVYAAYDPELDRKVAIKLLRAQPAGPDGDRRRARLQREAQAIAKLSHANVVSIFDVGVHDGQVFLAMEHLSGGTLAQWLKAKKRTWREILEVFVEIGHGLAAAHAEGLVHRDFKPDNVLLDRQGKPKIVDFGLVRLSSALDESTSAPGLRPGEDSAVAPAVAALAADLTRTGAMTGTPAYMAPEQFLGQPVSASSDQFAYCVALYEALYGARPFQGDNVILLAESVLAHKLTPAAAGAAVPPWIRRIIERGLAVKPSDRFPTMADLVRRLDRRPVTLKKAGAIGAVGIAASAALVIVISVVGGRARARAELEATISRSRAETQRHEDAASAKRAEAERLRTQAIHFFDEASGLLPGGAKADSWSRGETDWAKALEAGATAQSEYAHASTALEAALLVDPHRAEVRERMLRDIDTRLSLAEEFFERDLANELKTRLQGLKKVTVGSIASRDDATIAFPSRPTNLRISIAEYVVDAASGRLRLSSPHPVADDRIAIAPGSYLVTWTSDGKHTVRLPVLLQRGHETSVDLIEPDWSAVPNGFVVIPSGESLIGSDEENLRAALDVSPMHTVAVGSFLIGRFEVTFGEYIRWLETLPATERAARMPQNRSRPGAIELRYASDHRWTLMLQPTAGQHHVAVWGEPVRYPARAEHSVQDWRRFPVTAISFEDAQSYSRWLDSTAQVPGAHVCRDVEWERAARGADGRIYANGWQLLPSEANLDATYGRRDDTLGPDEVGSHPESASPFGAEDMEGNAGEMVAAARWGEKTALRGGSWYDQRLGVRADNRFQNAPSFRYLLLGFRICAPVATGGSQPFKGERQ